MISQSFGKIKMMICNRHDKKYNERQAVLHPNLPLTNKQYSSCPILKILLQSIDILDDSYQHQITSMVDILVHLK